MRYGMLNQGIGLQITFDLDQWCSLSGNTGPYLLYAYARARSILRRTIGQVEVGSINWELLTHDMEGGLISQLAEYPTSVERAAEQTTPQVLCVYVYELAKKFNEWFTTKECSVLHAESDALKAARTLLVDATGRVIQHALSLLGIPTIERM